MAKKSITSSAIGNHRLGQAAYWFLSAALASIAAFVLHECAHFLTAHLAGATGVIFHWGFVDHDAASVPSIANALIALAGPLSTYVMVAAAWWYSRNRALPFLPAFGFMAAFRNVLVLPFFLRTLLGRDTSTFFFDEIRGANALGVSPIFFVLLSLLVFATGTIFFTRKVKREQGLALMLVMIAGSFAGVFAWSTFGPMLFPGGPGFN